MMLKCDFVLENVEKSDVIGKEVLMTVPGAVDLSEVKHYRQSVDNEGNPEDYTILYTGSNMSFCIDMTIGEFEYNLNQYKKNVSKTV